MWVQVLASLGDLRMALVGTALVAALLAYRGERHLAMAFVSGILLSIAAIVAMKLAGTILIHASIGSTIGSPSGHTALGTALVGSIAMLLGYNRSAFYRIAFLVLAGLTSFIVAYSRIANDAHTTFEVVEGFVIGLLAPIVLNVAIRRRRDDEQTPALPVLPFATVVGVLVAFRIAVPLRDLDTEALIQLAAALLPTHR